MNNDASTRLSLLIRIQNHDDWESWNEFAEIYIPLIHRFACRQGLQEADAADLVQEVLRSVMRSIRKLKYDRNRGTFRGWLFQIARNKLKNHFGNVQRQPQGTGDVAMLADRLVDSELNDMWERDYEQRVFEWAADQVRTRFSQCTWLAFWKSTVEQQSPTDVAGALGVSVGAVYIAKSRVLAQLKKKVNELRENPSF